MTTPPSSLWSLVIGPPEIDPHELSRAVVGTMKSGGHDARTRLLLRDSLRALRRRWGTDRLDQMMSHAGIGMGEIGELESIGDPPAFPALESRLMEPLKPDTVRQLLREAGEQIAAPTRLVIGGSVSLILSAGLSRHTEDVDVVDEVPRELRENHDLLHRLTRRYGIGITHFQSHYLPEGFEARLRSLGLFGKLDVFVVDPLDVLLSKLFSPREKDRDDLRMLLPVFDRNELVERLKTTAQAFLADAKLRGFAQRNWYIVFGEDLPA